MANFNISAAVVYQLGEELVSDEITALMELVKNSYDADADYANVIIDTEARTYEQNGIIKECPNGYIAIEDNGKGMTKKDIEAGWLIISVSHKRQMKEKGETTEKGRTPMGDKGLGRLSTQRLGNALDMLTSRLNAPIKHLVSFNWQDFHSERLLTDVLVGIQEVPNPEGVKGTTLLISDLRNTHVWERERDSIRNKLSQLISPFSESRTFNVYLTINGEPIGLDKIAKKIRSAASSSYSFEYHSRQKIVIDGTIKFNKLNSTGSEADDYHQLIPVDNGKDFFNYLTNPKSKHHIPNIKHENKEGVFISWKETIEVFGIDDLRYHSFLGSSELADPGSFKGEIDDFKLRPDEALTDIFNTQAEYKEFVKRQVGIRIFRDGFGIRPYGYQGQDWLELARNQTSGHSFYGLRPNNVIGFVSLRGDTNGVLKEKTDREGFVENDYSRNFFTLMGIVRTKINEFIEDVRRGYLDFKEIRFKADAGLESTSYEESMKLMSGTSTEAKQVEKQIEALSTSVEQAEVVLAQAQQIIDENPDSEAISTLAPILATMQANLSSANELIQSTKIILPRIKRLSLAAKTVEPKIAKLQEQLTDFSELASLGLIAEGFSHELRNISDRLDQHTKQAEKSVEELYNEAFEEYIVQVRTSVGAMRKQLRHLTPTLRYVREKQEIISLLNFTREQVQYYRTNDPHIHFVIEESFQDFSIKNNRGRLTQVMDNLVLNSLYWLKEQQKRDEIFRPEIHFDSHKTTLYVWDNGPGIDNTVEHSLFKSFVTMKANGVGRGLGLFIVTQLLDSMDAKIELLPERNSFGRRYKFALTFSTKK